MIFRCAFTPLYGAKEQRNGRANSSMIFRCAFSPIYVDKAHRKGAL